MRVRDAISHIPAVTPFADTTTVADVIDVEKLPSAIGVQNPSVMPGLYNGEKFASGFGDTFLYEDDYWVLRARSSQLFKDNLYARGIIRRLVNNEINTGLVPEALPEELIIGVAEDSLADWSEDVETRFQLYANDKELCDYAGNRTFGQLQSLVRFESLVAGDILVVLVPNRDTGLPMVKLVNSNAVMTPPAEYTHKMKNDIHHGVEVDKRGRQVAYWVQLDDDQGFERIPAYGPRTGRRIAWLVYGIERRVNEHRGTPFLALMLQSIRELDRYRDAVQRKAVVNSIVAMFIRKDKDKVSTLPITNSSVRRDTVVENAQGSSSGPRRYNIEKHTPGVVFEELQEGEEPVPVSSAGTDLAFKEFEEAIVNTGGWANEIPPQVLRLDFSNSYSASQAATNALKIYLNRARGDFSTAFCKPVYEDWLLSSVIIGKVNAEGFFDAWNDPQQHDVYNAWISSDWSGAIKPSIDLLKQVNAYNKLIAAGLITRDQAAKELTGKKFSKNVSRLRKENEQLLKANEVLLNAGIEVENPESDLAAAINRLVDHQEENNA